MIMKNKDYGLGKKDFFKYLQVRCHFNDNHKGVGENMPVTVVINWVKHMMGVLREKHCKIFYHTHCKIFYHTHSETIPGQRKCLLETLWI